MEVIVIDNVFSETEVNVGEFNKFVIGKISNHHGWHLSCDEEKEQKNLEDKFSDTGMLLQSFFRNSQENSQELSEINYLAELIFSQAINSCPCKFTNIEPVRYLWNYYNRSSNGVVHRDMAEKIDGNYFSMVYYLNDSDGYTIVEDSKFESKSGKCIFFNSKLIHQGTGPVNSKTRFCLNVIFKYSEIILD